MEKQSLFDHPSGTPTTQGQPVPRKGGLTASKILTISGGLIALLLVYAIHQLHQADIAFRAQNEQTIKQLALITQRLEDGDSRIAELTANLRVSGERLGLTQSELERTRQVAARIREEQQRRVAELTEQLGQKATAEQVAALQQQTTKSLGTITSDVSATRQEVATVNKDLGSTREEVSDLKLKLSEYGTLIARNQDELTYLRRRGERDYFEFNISKGGFQQIANLSLKLRKADTKKQRYDLEYIADDRTLKRDKVNINEPIQVYITGLRQPYEIVVNRVQKDRIVGYVSAPKDRVASPGATIQ